MERANLIQMADCQTVWDVKLMVWRDRIPTLFESELNELDTELEAARTGRNQSEFPASQSQPVVA